MKPKKNKKPVNVNDQGHMCPTCGDIKPQDDMTPTGVCVNCAQD